MITPAEAQALILQHSTPLSPRLLPLWEAEGLVLATDTFAPIDIPAFPQSGMDGYAFRFSDWLETTVLEIAGEAPAGLHQPFRLGPGAAARIFTGAPVPEGADTVVMQEKTSVAHAQLHIQDSQLKMGANVRPKGSEIRQGEPALPARSVLSAPAIGFLAGIGLAEVAVFPHPKVTILTTGNELQTPGRPLAFGQVYESNSYTLQALLHALGIRNLRIERVRDDLQALAAALEQACDESDLVLLTGGVSVGDYDYVIQAAQQCGIQSIFHKISQKPGKPLFFGQKNGKPVFGLPGNPGSVLTCYYLYVLPALEQLTQRPLRLRVRSAPLAKAWTKNAGLTHFLKGRFMQDAIQPMGAQESYRMSSFALADGLIELGADHTECPEGMWVNVHILPHYTAP